jgi:mannosyltransferase OCH1-like enzyme
MVVIPKIVHRIWFGPHKMRDELVEYGRSWEAHGYQTVLWTEADLPSDCEMRPLMDMIAENGVNVGNGVPELGVWVQWADVVSYWLVWKYGGIYANTDMECLRSLDPLLDGVTAFAGIEVGDFIGNALFGATEGHPFFRELLDDLPARYEARVSAGQAMNEVTGPHCITDAHKRNPGLLTVLPQERFYPYSHVEMSREWDEWPDAYTSHHWGHTRDRHAL